MKRASIGLLLAAVSALSPTVMRADATGTTVSGTLNFGGFSGNYFDSTLGFVPAGYGNSSGSTSVVIGPGIEFASGDGNVLYTFDFTGTTLTVTNTVATPTPENSWVATFTDPAFTSLSTLSSTISGLTGSFSGDVITLDFAGHIGSNVSGNLGTSVYDIAASTSATPEPSSLTLLGTAATGLILGLRRRFGPA